MHRSWNKRKRNGHRYWNRPRIVASAEAGSGTPTPAEDQQVLELMKRLRKLEEEIGHLKRQAANT
jgi:hypothetical protein